MGALPPELAARLCQIDYDRQMALVAQDSAGAILGVSRIIADPEGETAEFAIIVRSDHQGRGLGQALLLAILEHALQRGIVEVWGDVARENARMLDFAAAIGFLAQPGAEPDRVRVVKRLVTARFGAGIDRRLAIA